MRGKFHNHNKGLIQQKERLKMTRLSEFVVPNVYASLILAMYDELKLEPEDIKRVVLRSQQIWNDYTDNGWDIKASCLECTGIDVEYFKKAGNIVEG